VRAITADDRLASWSHRLPRFVAAGELRGRSYLVESALPGHPAELLAADPAMVPALLAVTLRVTAELHALSGRDVAVGAGELERWVDQPVEEVLRLLPGAHASWVGRTLRRLRDELWDVLAGRRMCVGWVHGDLWLGNVLVSDDCAVTGLVDWDQAGEDEPGMHDLVHLLLYTRRTAERRELGDVVSELLARRSWPPAELRLVADVASWDSGLPVRAAVLLSWLRHVARIAGQPNHASNPLWRRRNVVAVIRALQATAGRGG
jgi:aminoglycoside phosphotransferase